ncbi:MAG: RluA family pseudouridine synthase [Spirochaetes bacterium]|jgi:23S rRNA pseudouridine955/2504/2580 synthase|nr:RluA family pseudouridine synthase [Spirochaetota bacterium]
MEDKTTERKSIVPDGKNSVRIDKYLAERFSYYSRTEWKKIITDGQVACNGEIILNPHKIIKGRDLVTYYSPEIEEPSVDKNYSIVFQDKWLIAANKPGNLPVHPVAVYYKNTLLTIMEEDLKMKLYPIHRLDRETSGAILFAKDSKTASAISKNFKNVRKTYIAIVHGTPEWKELKVDVPIGQDITSRIKKKRSAFDGGEKSSTTMFKKIMTLDGYTLLKAMPLTGRFHQIRTHCSYIGLPIVGDKLYGLDETAYIEYAKGSLSGELAAKMELARSALHSRSICFYHPEIKKHMRIVAPLPEDMKQFIKEKINSRVRGSRFQVNG